MTKLKTYIATITVRHEIEIEALDEDEAQLISKELLLNKNPAIAPIANSVTYNIREKKR